MKSTEELGGPLLRYEGIADAVFQNDETKIEARGYFEMRQFPSGRIAITIVPANLSHPTKITLRSGGNPTLLFHGRDLKGWELRPNEEMLFSPLSWLTAPMAVQPVTLNADARILEAKSRRATEAGYTRTRFLLSNLLWHHLGGDEPEPIKLVCQEYKVAVNPVTDYAEVAERLTGMGGVEPTALVTVECPPSQPQEIGVFTQFLDDLSYVFRLVSGNRVDWYYAEAIDEDTDSVVERVHKYSATSQYSNTLAFRPLRSGYQAFYPKLDLAALTEAFFRDEAARLDVLTLKTLIDYFTNACDRTSYLEAGGLLASTLTELIVAKYADAKGISDFMPEDEFNANVLPVIENAIESTNLEKDMKDKVSDHSKGAYRNTFRRRLKALVDDFKLPLSSKERNRLVNIRNTLVHQGTYPSYFDDGGWSNDYRFTIWANFVAICRLIGYEGELPRYQQGHGIEI